MLSGASNIQTTRSFYLIAGAHKQLSPKEKAPPSLKDHHLSTEPASLSRHLNLTEHQNQRDYDLVSLFHWTESKKNPEDEL